MIGTLGITPQGWKVSFEYWFIAPNGGVCDRSQLKECLYIRELPLHPDDNPDYEFGRDVVGEQIEFEMVWYKDVKYAKLINVDKLGNEDVPKLGYVPDVRKMVKDVEEIERLAELNGSPESSGFYDYKEGFVDGFLEAKSTLYTEEQVRKLVEEANYDGQYLHAKSVTSQMMRDNAESYSNEIIQSLKQD